MTFAATSSPGASTAAGQSGSTPPICQNCTTSTTPLWRRDEAGSVLCNACGLFLKLHGRPRPISLKTDVIKSRNRVKNSAGSAGGRKKPSRSTSPVQPYDPQLLIATPPQVEQPPTIESLVAANNKLKTRVAELELVNDLFRGRLGELENMESLLEAAGKREEELKRRIEVLEDGEQQRQRKKVRVADLTA